MRKYESYWQSNDDWCYFDESGILVLKEDAPPEAQESYKIYLEQRKRAAREIAEDDYMD